MSATELCPPGYQAGVASRLVLERPKAVPDAPGSYQFKDADGRVIYVGKALSLKGRLASYFGDPAQLHPRTQQMLERARSVEWIQVRSEVEAIMLEYSLIKEHRPHFNVRLVDDKSYPFITMTTDETWPRVTIMRGTKRKGTRYFGPYAQAYALREMLDMLVRSFPVRTCTNTKFARHERLGRPCLLYHIERCSGPCVGAVTAEEYKGHVEDLSRFLDGDTKAVVARLEVGMKRAAAAEEYEKAARFRDQLESARLAGEHQDVVGAADEPVVALGIAHREVAGQVPRPGEAFAVAFLLMQVTAQHRWPAGLQREFAFDHRRVEQFRGQRRQVVTAEAHQAEIPCHPQPQQAIGQQRQHRDGQQSRRQALPEQRLSPPLAR